MTTGVVAGAGPVKTVSANSSASINIGAFAGRALHSHDDLFTVLCYQILLSHQSASEVH